MKKTKIIELLSALFILLFLYTASSKLLDIGMFKSALGKSPLLKNFSGVLAYAIPVMEIIICCLLYFPTTRLQGIYAFLALMTGFTVYLGYILAFEEALPCSCGGVINAMSWAQHLVFNLVFIALAITTIWLQKNKFTYEKKHSGFTRSGYRA